MARRSFRSPYYMAVPEEFILHRRLYLLAVLILLGFRTPSVYRRRPFRLALRARVWVASQIIRRITRL